MQTLAKRIEPTPWMDDRLEWKFKHLGLEVSLQRCCAAQLRLILLKNLDTILSYIVEIRHTKIVKQCAEVPNGQESELPTISR